MGPILGGIGKRASFAAAQYAMSSDGNSIMTSELILPLQALAPINNQIGIHNRGIAGQTTRDMINSASDVDGAWEAGKINYLLVWEITNSIFNLPGRTGLQACDDLTEYIAARKAVHPWRVILMTAIPRGAFLDAYSAPAGEIELQAANAYIRANYRAMGAVAYVEARRAGGPFDFTDPTDGANFPSSLWADRTHPNAAGKAILAGYIADVLKRLPAR